MVKQMRTGSVKSLYRHLDVLIVIFSLIITRLSLFGVLQSHGDNTVQKEPRIWPPEK